jgi:hypothetical protein
VVACLGAEGEGADAFLLEDGPRVGHAQRVAVGEDGAAEADVEDVDAGEQGGTVGACEVTVDEKGEAVGVVFQAGR